MNFLRSIEKIYNPNDSRYYGYCIHVQPTSIAWTNALSVMKQWHTNENIEKELIINLNKLFKCPEYLVAKATKLPEMYLEKIYDLLDVADRFPDYESAMAEQSQRPIASFSLEELENTLAFMKGLKAKVVTIYARFNENADNKDYTKPFMFTGRISDKEIAACTVIVPARIQQ